MKVAYGFSRGSGFVSKSILKFGRLKTGECKWSHAFILIGDYIYEQQAEKCGVKCVHKSKYKDIPHILYYLPAVDEMNIIRARTECDRQVKSVRGIYAFTHIPLMALDSVFKTFWFTRTFGISNFKVCSEFMCWLDVKYLKSGIYTEWKGMSPDDSRGS